MITMIKMIIISSSITKYQRLTQLWTLVTRLHSIQQSQNEIGTTTTMPTLRGPPKFASRRKEERREKRKKRKEERCFFLFIFSKSKKNQCSDGDCDDYNHDHENLPPDSEIPLKMESNDGILDKICCG
jgi:hypothetical protein